MPIPCSSHGWSPLLQPHGKFFVSCICSVHTAAMNNAALCFCINKMTLGGSKTCDKINEGMVLVLRAREGNVFCFRRFLQKILGEDLLLYPF